MRERQVAGASWRATFEGRNGRFQAHLAELSLVAASIFIRSVLTPLLLSHP